MGLTLLLYRLIRDLPLLVPRVEIKVVVILVLSASYLFMSLSAVFFSSFCLLIFEFGSL